MFSSGSSWWCRQTPLAVDLTASFCVQPNKESCQTVCVAYTISKERKHAKKRDIGYTKEYPNCAR